MFAPSDRHLNPISDMHDLLCESLLEDLTGMRKGSGFVLIYAALVMYLHAHLGTQIGQKKLDSRCINGHILI